MLRHCCSVNFLNSEYVTTIDVASNDVTSSDVTSVDVTVVDVINFDVYKVWRRICLQ